MRSISIHFDGGEAFERLQQEIQEALRSKVDEAEAWKTKLGQKKASSEFSAATSCKVLRVRNLDSNYFLLRGAQQ